MAHSKTEGNRILRLEREREKERTRIEEEKKKIKEDNKAISGSERFSSTMMLAAEEKFRVATVGLVTADEFKKKRKLAYEEAMKESGGSSNLPAPAPATKKRKKSKKTKANLVSFDFEDGEEESVVLTPSKTKKKKGGEEGEEEEEAPRKFGKFGKDPSVNTEFLPDRDREEEQRKEEERLKQEWIEEQARIKEEVIQVTYSYWDGSGHRRTIDVKKGTTIERFLEMVRKEFRQLRGVSVEDLVYVKEDLIIPQHYSFYDLIVTKARGKSGPLFHFDVHEDIRMMADAKKEKDEVIIIILLLFFFLLLFVIIMIVF